MTAFKYYEEGKRERITMRKAYRQYITCVDDDQKAQGTDFTSWLHGMERMGILNKL